MTQIERHRQASARKQKRFRALSGKMSVPTPHREDAMKRFLARFEDRTTGIVAGPDRLLFRGALRSISYTEGLEQFMGAASILHKDFKRFALSVSGELCEAAKRFAQRQGRPYEYLHSKRVSKEEYAEQIARQDGVKEGLICVLACVESCQTFRMRKNRERKKLEVVPHRGQCRHLYFYFLDHEFGLMHVRLQTWLPLTVQVCLNGREWLARKMQARGIEHEQQDNCFTQIADVEQAQDLMDRLPLRRWVARLNAWAGRINPWLRSDQGKMLKPYYWSLRESEYATDVMFKPGRLAEVYPAMVRHAIEQYDCYNVLRYMGKRRPNRCRSDVRSHLGRGPDGVRVKHWVEENSIKMYDKKGCVLRVETTINNARRFKVRRKNRDGEWVWMPLRKGIADFRRRMQICHAANARYLDALACVVEPSPASTLLDPVSRPVWRGQRRYRALRPISPEDAVRLQLLAREDFLLRGVSNRALQRHWPVGDNPAKDQRALSGRIGRWLALMVAHRFLQRVESSHNYRLTQKAQRVLATVRRVRQTETEPLAA
jgi:hypothetical protein